jgi:hypothetical protein
MDPPGTAVRAMAPALAVRLPIDAWSQVSIKGKTNVVVLEQAPAGLAGGSPRDRPFCS